MEQSNIPSGSSIPQSTPATPVTPANQGDDLREALHDHTGNVMLALAVGFGAAGVASWEAGAFFYWFPLGMAAASAALWILALVWPGKQNGALMLVALVAVIGAGAVGLDKRSDAEDISDNVNQSLDFGTP